MNSNYRRLNFSDVHLYWVTPSINDPALLLERTEQVLKGGADAVQLRCKELPDRELAELGRQMKAKCQAHGALFLVNNRIDIALAVDSDGVHLGHQDLPIAFAREVLGHRRIIGASAHSLPQALAAQREGADYVSCGPLWATPTKPDYPPVGLGLIGLYKAAMRVPFVAIGGVDENNIDQVVQAGANRVAVVRALFNASDPAKLAQTLKAKLESGATVAAGS